MAGLVEYKIGFLTSQQSINFLSQEQLNSLTASFQAWYDDRNITDVTRKKRGRHWLVFLVLRYTGARLSEVLNLNYDNDIDFRNAEIRLITLKRHNPNKRNQYRIIPVPATLIAEISRYVAEFPDMRKTIFSVHRSNFFKVFKRHSISVNIPEDLAHPHILRHTRAIELLRAGVPVTIVQAMLGLSSLTTTAIYLRISGQEAKGILREKGLI